MSDLSKAGFGVLHRLKVDWVPFLVGFILLGAASLKANPAGREPFFAEDLETRRWLSFIWVELEMLLGLWLWSGVRARVARSVALICFTIFVGVSLYKAIHGEESCGCLGNVAMSPWAMALADLVVLAALLRWKVTSDSAASRFCSTGLGLAGLMFAVATAIAMTRSEAVTLVDADSTREGAVVILEPDNWAGKRFPLFRYLDIGANLAKDRWEVVLYHADCPRCQQVLSECEQRAQSRQGVAGMPSTALIQVSPERAAHAAKASACYHGRLVQNRRWFVQTPVAFVLKDGYTVSVQR